MGWEKVAIRTAAEVGEAATETRSPLPPLQNENRYISLHYGKLPPREKQLEIEPGKIH